jgi:methyl-accepting chemotaxis protein
LINVKYGLKAGLLFVCALILAGCGDSKETTVITIEDQVISVSADSQKQAAVTQFIQAKKDEVAKLSKLFASNFPGGLSLDSANTNNVKGVPIPTLMLNGQSLHFDHAIADKFTAQTGAVATLFVKSGNEFVRVSTSLKKEDGARAFGTTLSNKHPGYNTSLNGNSYTGTATLFGVIYMTEYTPILDTAGSIIGIQFVGIDITGDLVDLKAKLR